MPLFINLPSPHVVWSFLPFAGGTAAITAGAAFFAGFELYAPTTFNNMRTTISGAPTGNVDMGIYDALGSTTNSQPGTLLAHTGAIAATAGTFTKALTANLTIGPGRYFLAIVDTVADTLQFIQPGASIGVGIGAYWRTSSTALTVLPASAGALTQVASTFGVEALVLNGYS